MSPRSNPRQSPSCSSISRRMSRISSALSSVKRLFVQRRAVKEVKEVEAAGFDGDALREALGLGGFPGTRAGVLAWERRYAETVTGWLDDEAVNAAKLR